MAMTVGGRDLTRDRRGVAALEFAIVSVPFIGLVVGLGVVALNLYLQQALDFALRQAVRQVQLGQLAGTTTSGQFVSSVFCPGFVAFAACGSIVATLVPVADFQSAGVVSALSPAQLGTSGGFCVGRPGQLMFARIVYLAPLVSQFWPYAAQATVDGATGTALIATAAFANENPSGAAYPTAGGC